MFDCAREKQDENSWEVWNCFAQMFMFNRASDEFFRQLLHFKSRKQLLTFNLDNQSQSFESSFEIGNAKIEIWVFSEIFISAILFDNSHFALLHRPINFITIWFHSTSLSWNSPQKVAIASHAKIKSKVGTPRKRRNFHNFELNKTKFSPYRNLTRQSISEIFRGIFLPFYTWS